MLPHAVRRVFQWGRKLMMLNGSPRGIALGFAMGLALSLFPIPVAGMVVALALTPFVRANPAATYLGTAIVNPLTGPAFYFAELWLGATLVSYPVPAWDALARLDGWGWWHLFLDLLGPFGLGAGVMMSVAFLVAYPTVRWAVGHWRRSSVFAGPTDAHHDPERDHDREHVRPPFAEEGQRQAGVREELENDADVEHDVPKEDRRDAHA